MWDVVLVALVVANLGVTVANDGWLAGASMLAVAVACVGLGRRA